jgi:protein-disulfide isomerase
MPAFLRWAVLAVLILGISAVAGAQSKATAGDSSSGKTFGSKDAPITMEVFSDFQCPSCRLLYEDSLKFLMNDYVASGKVYLVHRDFPLPMHKYSRIAARYANAAARIGKYEQVEAALYDNQASWSADGNIEKFVAAALAPAEMKKVNKLMDGCREDAAGVKPAKMGAPQAAHECQLDAAIDKDIALGQQIPVQATPTYVIRHGDQHTTSSGAISYPVLKQYFDYLLSH